jgi:phospholipase/carboxylesterase
VSQPLILLLHGLGHDPLKAVETFAPALHPDMPLLAPPGPFPFGDQGGRAWFEVAFTDGVPVVNLAQEWISRAAVIAIAERQQVPVIVCGFGQGGSVALAAFLDRPELFEACAVASGRLLPEALPTCPPRSRHQGKPVFWAHGRADPAIAFAAAEGGRAALTAYGVDLLTVDHDGGHELPAPASEELRLWLSAQRPSSPD